MRRKIRFFENPFKWYINKIKNGIEPTNPTHEVSMRIDIPKGEIEGRALIPCSIYTLSHSIDLNPSLIRKKDGKILKQIPVKQKISYDSNKYDVVLTEEEKNLGYQLKEIERCEHCGQKLVIAELAETRYRSCPDIKVRVADKAKEDLVIPVKYGVRKGQILFFLINPFILDFIFIYIVLHLFFNINLFSFMSISNFSLIPKIFLYLILTAFFLFLCHTFISSHYRAYKLFKWYSKVKPTLKKINEKNWRNRG